MEYNITSKIPIYRIRITIQDNEKVVGELVSNAIFADKAAITANRQKFTLKMDGFFRPYVNILLSGKLYAKLEMPNPFIFKFIMKRGKDTYLLYYDNERSDWFWELNHSKLIRYTENKAIVLDKKRRGINLILLIMLGEYLFRFMPGGAGIG